MFWASDAEIVFDSAEGLDPMEGDAEGMLVFDIEVDVATCLGEDLSFAHARVWGDLIEIADGSCSGLGDHGVTVEGEVVWVVSVDCPTADDDEVFAEPVTKIYEFLADLEGELVRVRDFLGLHR